jgi:rubrerythrin
MIKDNMVNCIKRQPTADVEEVRHGRWLPIIERSSYLDPPYYDTGKCSSCGYVVDVSEMNHKYCPECGAKMDGERSDNGE